MSLVYIKLVTRAIDWFVSDYCRESRARIHVGFVTRQLNVLVQFDVSDDAFRVSEGDHIGWTGHVGDNRFISRDDDDSQCQDCTHYRFNSEDSSQYFCVPTVRQRPYKGIILSPRQFVFSAAVRINRRKYRSVSLTLCKHQPVVCSSCSHYLCLPWF